MSGGSASTPQQVLEWVHRDISRQQRKLESIKARLELYDDPGVSPGDIKVDKAAATADRKIFVVHGQNDAVKLEVADFLEKVTGERPIILHEKVDGGSRTIIEKFEDHAHSAGFAVVLLTADDVGGTVGSDMPHQNRPRQNVVFEFGYFVGKLGRQGVVALYQEGVELPSDVSGVLYKPLSGNWHTELAKELRAAGFNADLGKL